MQMSVGDVFPTKNFGDVEVVKYVNSTNVTVRFLNTGTIKSSRAAQIRSGLVQDNFATTVYGVGYIGNTKTSVNAKHKPAYVLWKDMLKRCYDKEYQETHPCYRDCYVSNCFKSFQNFEVWCEKQVGFNEVGFRLDKDILLKGNKVYSPTTCSFVPYEVNGLFVIQQQNRGELPVGVSFNVTKSRYVVRMSTKSHCKHLSVHDTVDEAFSAYKQAKEKYIQQLANKWKDQIDPRVYDALMNWEVNITD